MVNREKYGEYRESLLNIARLTKKNNSILINFRVDGDNCYNVVSYIQQDGTKDILKDSVFVCDDEFYKDFLEKFVIEYCSNMVVAFNDSIDMNTDGKYTYRVVTDDNDMLSIDDISLDYANYLMSLSKKVIVDASINNDDDIDNSVVDQKGITTVLTTFLLVGLISISFLITFLILS